MKPSRSKYSERHKTIKSPVAFSSDLRRAASRNMQLFALLSFLGGASALIASPLAAHATQQRVAVSPMMACNGGKGGRGGEGPPLDKMRRGRVKALIQAVRRLPLAPHRA